MKLLNLKDKNRKFQAIRQIKQITYKEGKKIRLASDFSAATLNDRSQLDNVYQILRKKSVTQERKKTQPRCSSSIKAKPDFLKQKNYKKTKIPRIPSIKKKKKG